MANETKTQDAPKEQPIEKQAFDANGKLKAGFAFRFVPSVDANGRKVSRREVFKVGK